MKKKKLKTIAKSLIDFPCGCPSLVKPNGGGAYRLANGNRICKCGIEYQPKWIVIARSKPPLEKT